MAVRDAAAPNDPARRKGVLLSVSSPIKIDAPGPIGHGGLWRRSASRGVVAAMMVGLLWAGFASPAIADMCANTAARSQTGSEGLPDCRGYEMVSPPYKEGFSIEPSFLSFTDNGLVSYLAPGSFAGNAQGSPLNRYHATRSPAGWITAALSPPDVTANTGGQPGVDSASLSASVWTITRRDVPGDKAGFYRRSLDGAFTRIGDAEGLFLPTTGAGRIAASADLSHIVVNHGVGAALYEYVGTGNDSPPRAVSVDNNGQFTPVQTCPNSISGDGRVIVYTAGCNVGTPQVWARVGGTASIAVSGSECTRTVGDPNGACNGVSAATWQGGAADGSRQFFTTSQQLVNGDIDATNDLYACDIPAGSPVPVGSANRCAALTEVTGNASNAQVEGVVAVSKDGSRVYFVAKGVLAQNLGVDGVGPATVVDVPEPHNLYVWKRDSAHPAGETRFISRLSDVAGDGIANDVEQAQLSSDGRYLLFLSANRMVTTGTDADTDSAVDAYRYDAVTHAIVRISTSVTGGGGNDSSFGVSMVLGAPSMTADGSTVIFDTAEALALSDTDGITDVYVWHEDGRVSLITPRGGSSVGITPSGRDIFFITEVPVLAADGDFIKDIYDARVGGGFAVAQTPPCSGDGCRGPQSQAPTLAGPAVPASGSSEQPEFPPAFSLRAVSAAQRKAMAKTGKVTLTVTANVPGTISVNASATLGGRPVAVGSARVVTSVAGKVSIPLTLSKRARSQLGSRGHLTVRLAVSHAKVALDRSATLKLVRAKAKPRRAARAVHGSRSGSAVGEGRS